MKSMEIQAIAKPVDKELLLSELKSSDYLRSTKNGSNELYVVTAGAFPNVMHEIGRLRELSFRDSGGGTGNEIDIDDSDLAHDGYKQLIVWNPSEKEIIGGYRFIVSDSTQPKHMSTEHYFRFTDKFREEYLPYMIELGRSFVQPKYQSRAGGFKSIYALDNLWDGLGALISVYPHVKYFFGKVTMYNDYNKDARNKLLYFLSKYCKDRDNLVESINPIDLHIDHGSYERIFTGNTFNEDYKILTKELKYHSENIPPLINAYMNLSPSMKVFGTVTNPDFGNVEETGILITISDIYTEKLDRYMIKK